VAAKVASDRSDLALVVAEERVAAKVAALELADPALAEGEARAVVLALADLAEAALVAPDVGADLVAAEWEVVKAAQVEVAALVRVAPVARVDHKDLEVVDQVLAAALLQQPLFSKRSD
jgi:hypothetical protein